jgi:hypothetical protein
MTTKSKSEATLEKVIKLRTEIEDQNISAFGISKDTQWECVVIFTEIASYIESLVAEVVELKKELKIAKENNSELDLGNRIEEWQNSPQSDE